MTSLEGEPGIVLVEVERSLMGGSMAGLVDPLATDPSQLLLESRIDTSRVETRWEPYLSFDPHMVAVRARRVLEAPESVQLDLVGDTLYASGTATFDWESSATPLVAMVPGVTHLDFSRADLTLPNDLEDLKQQIEERRLLFNIGSSALTAPAPDLITEIAAVFVDLIQAGNEQGYDVSLELIGRTDTTGSNETNRVLSVRRAMSVQRALLAEGVPGSVLTATGIGTSDPVESDDPQTSAALNRSVSLAVTVTFGFSGGGGAE